MYCSGHLYMRSHGCPPPSLRRVGVNDHRHAALSTAALLQYSLAVVYVFMSNVYTRYQVSCGYTVRMLVIAPGEIGPNIIGNNSEI